MDQAKKINQPKFADKYKDVEARRAYQRKYQLERYHRQKSLTDVATEGVMETKQIVPVSSGENAPVDQFGAALNSLAESLGPDDGVSKFIKKVQPFIPLATSFIKGFVDNMNATRVAQAQPVNSGPVPPEGWLYVDGITKLKKKYNPDGSLSQWYLAGEYYDQQVALRGVGANVQNGMPVRMEETYHGQREAAIQRRQQQMIQHERTMQDLQRESQVFDKKEAQVVASEPVQETKAEDISGDQAKQIVQEIAPKLQEDAMKYLNIVVEYFKTRPLDQFENDLKNLDDTLKKYKGFIDLLPFQAKEAFKRISSEEIEGMIKESDSEKYKMIVKKKLKGKLAKLWEELKSGF